MKLIPLIAYAAIATAASEYSALQFANFGYDGSYNPVSALNDPESDQCSCEVGEPVSFSGANSPLDGEVALHFRGPLQLSYVYAFSSDDFTIGNNDSSWKPLGWYNGTHSENLTFLAPAGADSKCLGKALAYADSDGTSKADKATLLSKDAQLKSNEELYIFTDKKCGDSGANGDCGVYRKDIPAYHGFEGKAKLFVFTWKMINDQDSSNSVDNFNKSSISVLNAHIPRTSTNFRSKDYANCSCWSSGCGELAAFEATDDGHNDRFSTTLHGLQGSDDVDSGVTIDGYTLEQPSAHGAVLFDTNGDVVVVSSLVHFVLDSNISSAGVNSMLDFANQTKKTQVHDLSKSSGDSGNGGNKGGDKDDDKKSDATSLGMSKTRLAVVVAAMVASVL